ncbi:hypothetical protein [Kitasatospora sp. NPDC088548]|uniref:hypothetical protein n=1 Tax=Kitasatospora sp. NPDC088548 TaxID=3364075 RepID=UPI003828A22A
MVGAYAGWTGHTRAALDWFAGDGIHSAIDLVPVGVAALIAWKTRKWRPAVAWILRIPLGTAVFAALLPSTPLSPETQMITLADPPTTDLGGTGWGAITVGGLAALATWIMWLLLKGKKGKGGGLNPEVDKKLSWEFLAAGGFITGNLYAAAGWNAVALLINGLTKQAAAAWGSGIVALGITAWIILRQHSRWGAAILGLSAAVLYNTAGDWFSFGSIGVVWLVEAIQGMA